MGIGMGGSEREGGREDAEQEVLRARKETGVVGRGCGGGADSESGREEEKEGLEECKGKEQTDMSIKGNWEEGFETRAHYVWSAGE